MFQKASHGFRVLTDKVVAAVLAFDVVIAAMLVVETLKERDTMRAQTDADESGIASPHAWSSLLFFDNPLHVRWNVVVDGATATDAERARSIAGELLSARPDPPWPRASIAVRTPAERLRRASLLTARALRRDASASLSATAELWLEVDAEWHWASHAESARSHFVERARALGAVDPEWVATAVAEAIRVELVPLLHLRGLLLVNPEDTERTALHRGVLARWTVPESAGDELVTTFGWWLLLLARDGADPTSATDASVVNLVRARTIDDPLVARIVAYYARLHLGLVGKRLEKKVGVRWFKERLEALEELEQSGHSTIAVFEAISTMALALGVQQLANKGTIADGVYHVARALIFDPTNGTAREQYRGSIATAERLKKERDAITARGARLSAEGYLLINGFVNGVANARTLLESEEATEIAQRLEQAAHHGLAWRLGIPVNDEIAREQVRTFARVVDQAGTWAASQTETPVSPADYASIVRSWAISADPALERLAWERLNPILERGALPNADYLALLVAEPELPDVSTVSRMIHETLSDPPPSPARPRYDWAATWLFSARDPKSKLAFAAGLLLLAYGMGARATYAARDAIIGRSYDRVVVAIRSQDDSAVADAGLAFLDRRGSAEDDPRVDQVSTWVDAAVARRVLVLAGAERADAAKQLLARYENTRAEMAIAIRPEGGTQ